MNSSNEQLTINNEVVNQSRKGESHENGQETNLISRRERREIIRRVPNEKRETIKKLVSAGSLKNTYIDTDGNLCFIMLKDLEGPSISFYSLSKNYGVGKKYDPTPKIQRRDKQHSSSDRKQILLSYLSEEFLGKILMVNRAYLDGQRAAQTSSYYIIDGRQRSSIIIEFLNDNLVLRDGDAKNFWKWYLSDEYLYSDKLSGGDTLTANKIINSFVGGKVPSVKFSSLPDVIKNHIMEDFSIHTTVCTPEVWKLTDTEFIKVDESQWDMEKIQDAISRKFTDINRYIKKIDNKDIIRTCGEDVVRKVWDFLEDKPTLAKEMGYTLVDVLENGFYRFDDTNEVRKLQILISRALSIYENHLQWGSSENELQKKISNGVKLEFSTKTQTVWGNWKKFIGNEIFDETYYDGGDKKFNLYSEFVGGGSDIMKLKFFLTTLYLMEIMVKDNYGAYQGFLVKVNQQESSLN